MDEKSRAPNISDHFLKILIVGPTAVGKSALALNLARKLNGEIVNCDSLQFYQEISVGTAKPTLADRQQVPHHLFDIVPLGQNYTAADCRRSVFELLTKQTIDFSKPLIFVGGSGFYIQALETGLFQIPKISQEVRNQSRKWQQDHTSTDSHKFLQSIDPVGSQSIHPNDNYRIMRSLEVYWQTGKPLSSYRSEFSREKESFFQLKIGLRSSRSHLATRIQERVTKMLAAGWIEECENLFAKGLRDWPPLNCVGYKEIGQFLAGNLRHEELAPSIIKSTLALAKRQRTWFQRDPSIVWFEADSHSNLDLGWNHALNFGYEEAIKASSALKDRINSIARRV